MFRITATASVGILCVSFMSGAAAAQSVSGPRALGFGSAQGEPLPNATLPAHTDLQAVSLAFEPVLAPRIVNPFPTGLINAVPPTRPRILPVLYASLIGLQAYDGYSTITGTAGGATETNPLLGKFTDNSYAIWAVKGGVTLASIYAAERLWRQRHRGEAVAVMIVSNGLMAGVAARNASVKRAQ
jgi:hypothetical protein